MDKLLHRGKYAVADDTMLVSEEPVRGWQAVIGIDKNFTLKDKIIYVAVSSINIVWAVVFVVGTIYNLIFDVPDTAWMKFWHLFAWLSLVFGIGTTIWFTWCGVIDLRNMFQRLKVLVRNDKDDGTV
jgi:SSS family solute:Na+ symporter